MYSIEFTEEELMEMESNDNVDLGKCAAGPIQNHRRY